jgi:hypothetical protein
VLGAVDHEPAPPGVSNFFIKSGAIPIAMSKFGQMMLGRLDPLYVPHAHRHGRVQAA